MPTLPDFQSFGERPAPTVPRRTPNIATYDPTSGFEGAAGQELNRAANDQEQAMHFAIQAKEHTDTLAAESAFNALRQKQIDLSYGKDGFMNLKGADTVNRDVPGQYGAMLTGASDKLSTGLANDYQRQLFSNRAVVAQQEMQSLAFRHVAQQSDVYANQVLDGTLDTESRVAAAGGDIATSLLRMNAAIDRHSLRFGTAEEMITGQKMKAASSLWSAKIAGMIPGDPFGAQKLFNEHRTEIGPEHAAVLEHQVKAAVQPNEARADASAALQSILVKPTLSGQGADTDPTAIPGMLGIRGDPQEIARQLADDVNVSPADRAGILAQMQRQMAAGGVTAAPRTRLEVLAKLGEGEARTAAMAEQRHPGDAVYADLAQTQFIAHMQRIARATDGVTQKLSADLENDAITKKYTSLDDMLANPANASAWALTAPTTKRWLTQLVEHNAKAANGEFTKSDPQLFNSIRRRFYGDTEDGPQFTSPAQLTPYFANGINAPDSERLRKEYQEAQTPEGNPFLKQVNHVKETGRKMLTQSMSTFALAHPDLAEEAAYRFGVDMDSKIAEARKAGGSAVSDLFNPTSKTYVLSPGRVSAFMPTEAQAVAAKAATGTPPKIQSEADYAKLPPGPYIDPEGVRRVKK